MSPSVPLSNETEMELTPSDELLEVMKSMLSTPLICCSSTEVTPCSTASASAPTYCAVTFTVGGAISGRFSIGRIGIAISPTITISRLQTVLRTGLVMKLLDADIVQIQLA